MYWVRLRASYKCTAHDKNRVDLDFSMKDAIIADMQYACIAAHSTSKFTPAICPPPLPPPAPVAFPTHWTAQVVLSCLILIVVGRQSAEHSCCVSRLITPVSDSCIQLA